MEILNDLRDLGYSKLASMIQEGGIDTNDKAFAHICNEGPELNSRERIDASKKAITLVTRHYNSKPGNQLIIIVSNYKFDEKGNISSFMIGHVSVRPVSLVGAITASNEIVNRADKVGDLDMRRAEIIDVSGEVIYSNDIELK